MLLLGSIGKLVVFKKFLTSRVFFFYFPHNFRASKWSQYSLLYFLAPSSVPFGTIMTSFSSSWSLRRPLSHFRLERGVGSAAFRTTSASGYVLSESEKSFCTYRIIRRWRPSNRPFQAPRLSLESSLCKRMQLKTSASAE